MAPEGSTEEVGLLAQGLWWRRGWQDQADQTDSQTGTQVSIIAHTPTATRPPARPPARSTTHPPHAR